MSANLQRARELFLHAVGKLPPDQWEDYIAEASGGDDELQQQVRYLLQVHREAGSFLEQPVVAMAEPFPTLDQPFAERPGTQIGPYKLLQEIGHGGMGVVYMAEQTEPVERRVALKIIKPGMDTRQVIARFEAERQALAMMDHPNIAKVLDAGTTDSGRPYFVMELVKGVPITQYCDEQKLSPRERLELFVPVCHAVQHAHQKGIIHRDIKPTNVLVCNYDDRPMPKIIDFGVAKAIEHRLTEKTMFTEFGQVVGTIEYMSPEQARLSQLDIDTRSDIYSLGVVLYELLIGETPFDRQRLRSAAWDEMLRIIREEEPPRPSVRLSSSHSLPSIAANRHIEPNKLGTLVRGELDWIVMKAMEKDRTRRYETANGLANDIQRYLNDEAVVACPPSAAYRLRKLARRNKVAMATTGLVAAVLVLGLVGTSWQAIRATRAEQQAQANEQRALENEHEAIEERDQKEAARREALASAHSEAAQRKVAEAALQAERQAKEAEAQQRQKAEAAEKQAAEEAAVAKAVNGFLQQDLLGLASAEAQLEAKIEPDPDLKLATLLDRALAKVNERFADQPRVRAEIQATLAAAFKSIGRYEEAMRLWEQVRKDRQETCGLEDPDTLTAMSNSAEMYLEQAKYAEAERLSAECLEIRRRVLGAEHPATLVSVNNLALVYRAQGRAAEAEPLLAECLEIRRRVQGAEHPATLVSVNNLAAFYREEGRYAEAESLYTEALNGMRGELGAEHPITLGFMDNLGVLYKDRAKYAEAELLLTEALELKRRVLGPEHPDTLLSMDHLAGLYGVQARYTEAESLVSNEAEIRRRVSGPDHPETLSSMNHLGVLYMDQAKYAEAESLLTQVLEKSRGALGSEHRATLCTMNNLAALYWQLNKLEKSIPLFEELLKIRRQLLGEAHPDTLLTMANLGVNYRCAGRLPEALPLLEQSLRLTQEWLGSEHPVSLDRKFMLAQGYFVAGRYAEAEPLYIQVLEGLRGLLGAEHPKTLNAMSDLGLLYSAQGRYAEAEPLLKQLLEIRCRELGKERDETLGSMNNLGSLYIKQAKYAEAESLLTQALEISRRVLGPDHVVTLASKSNLAELSMYRQLNKLKNSILWIGGAVASPKDVNSPPATPQGTADK